MIRVLLVEDDPMVAELNRAYVGSVDGFTVIGSVRSGQEALEIMRGQTRAENSQSNTRGQTQVETQGVDLVLLDIYMPGMQGLELLAEIRSHGLGADVILVTAASDTKSIREALRLGAVDYLIKPFEFERLKKALLGYKEKMLMFRQKNSVSQSELDQLLSEKNFGVSEIAGLPKGLDRTTLKKIIEVVATFPQKDFSADEIAKTIGITRVSVRKYLEFMTEVKAVKMNVIYGAIGRPVHRFERLPGFERVIDRYMEEGK
jgi:CitB family two-component system response regulator MalR